jgi:Holliday junction resolvase
MTRINSRQKGASYEREVAKKWTEETGMAAERGARNGVEGGDDVMVEGDAIHLECKRRKRLAVSEFVHQAVRDAGDRVPVVVMRADREDDIVLVRLKDLSRLARELNNHPHPTEE